MKTKTILDIVNRAPQPAPWSEGDNIPWNDPAFSERMLREHLSQEHDLASRKSATINEHVDWIFSTILDGRPSRLLDLGCGPGLYAHRLAMRGCECVGMDFSPAIPGSCWRRGSRVRQEPRRPFERDSWDFLVVVSWMSTSRSSLSPSVSSLSPESVIRARPEKRLWYNDRWRKIRLGAK